MFAFHLTHVAGGLDAENRATRELIDRIRDRGKVMLTGCTVAGRFLARVCILSFRTRQAQVDTLVEQIEDARVEFPRGPEA